MLTFSTGSILLFGFLLGLKHAVEADHLAAVSTIVSERKSLLSSSLVGGLWGVGHTISLIIAGVVVILFHFEISEKMSQALEFCVGLMLVALGVNALRKLARGGHLHLHVHQHGGRAHIHPHVHDHSPETHDDSPDTHDGSHEAHDGPAETIAPTHHGLRLGARPLLVGMLHGFAGSAALMLMVLSTIPSPLLGFAYIVVFGVGSIGGMMLMSALVGLPVYLTAARFNRANLTVRGMAGLFSLSFGLFMLYEIGFIKGLFR
ncbi:MAG: hypothetical protein QOF02_414 [Blastocatellia bacterium]|jgi:high-affinity nickel-transport protein|nr:hypothetical protein [Blastocatellia bacterium]